MVITAIGSQISTKQEPNANTFKQVSQILAYYPGYR